MERTAEEIAASYQAWLADETVLSSDPFPCAPQETHPPRAYPLFAKIIALSQAQTWDEAKKEWSLDWVRDAPSPMTCLCGHYPIKTICHISNRLTMNDAIVGNCCIHRFEEKHIAIVEALQRVARKPSASFPPTLIEVAFKDGVLDDWERRFYLDIRPKRVLSPKQYDMKLKLNHRVLARYLKQGGERK